MPEEGDARLTYLYCSLYELLDALEVSHIDRNGRGIAAGFPDFPLDRVDGRLRRVGIGRERMRGSRVTGGLGGHDHYDGL